MVLSEQMAEAKVVDVLWTASKHGHLKPRIKIEPVNIGGAMIEYATAFNAKYVQENKLGIGSIVKLVRSGDVIPHIMEVIQPAPEAKMPDVPYEWDETRVNITLTGAEEDRTVREKIIGAFFKKMDVVGLGPGNVTRLYDAGFDSVPKILAMEPDDYLTVDGFKQKTADKLYGSIRKKVMDAKSPKALANIMAGSNLFGRGVGERKITAIFKVYPDILTTGEDDDVKVQMITENVEGFASKTAKQFVKNIPPFLEFMKEANLLDKLDDYLNSILPKAFAVVKETTKRFKNNKEISVKATPFDENLSSIKSYVKLNGKSAIWSNSWDAAGKSITWDMIHYDVQLIGGIALHQGKIAEMQTGEGKTLVATLPVYLNALSGNGVHLITVNDYLAKRDCAWMAPIFEFHGLSVDCIDNYKPHSEERKKAYLCDITYGTNNEFGFDYLRDNMAHKNEDRVQREHSYAIVDEVDSVLIDDARTPLIISGPIPQGGNHEFNELKSKISSLVQIQKQLVTKILSESKKLYSDGNIEDGSFKLLQAFRGLPKNKALIKFLSEEGIKQSLLKTENFYMQDNNREMPKVDADLYFTIDEKNNQIELTDKGVEQLSKDINDPGFFVLPDVSIEIANIESKELEIEKEAEEKEKLYSDFSEKSERIHTLNQLLKAYTLFEKDIEYVVMDNKVKIVDEQTGRIMDGRRYSDGLHQAIEAKENVKIEDATQTFATITLQNYFRKYRKLSGMTGTAVTEAGEFLNIYKLDVMVIPTNKPIARDDRNDLIYKTKREKYNAVINNVIKLTEQGRPVLIGTTSVEISELLSRMLDRQNIKHNVLNAKLHKREADVVAEAGKAGVVTIATNMAGRGTDIKISDEIKNKGGLAIIGTERHDSRRVDRQLRGRSGRQGDPGSSQFYVSLEDNLMRLFGSERVSKLMDRMGHKEGEVIQHSMMTKTIERAQKKVEENNFGIRKRLLEYDDVMNVQREAIYKRRKNALDVNKLKIDVADMIYDTIAKIYDNAKVDNDFKAFEFEIIKCFSTTSPVTKTEFENENDAKVINKTYEIVLNFYKEKNKENSVKVFPIVKNVYENPQNKFERIVVPFSDGKKTMNIVTNLKDAYESNGQ